MRTKVIVDAGPLVAALSRRDRHHSWVKRQLNSIQPPLLTCESVLSEVCFLLRRVKGGSEAVFKLIDRGLVTIPFQLQEEVPVIAKLMARYASVPMSLADACLVRMCEQHAGSLLLTMDRDFQIYRKNGREVIPTLMPARP